MLRLHSIRRAWRCARHHAAWCALAWLVALPHASASPVFETMGATLGQGGFNARVSSPGAASTYYNPALLPQAKQGLDVGWFFFHDAIGITLMGRDPAVDVPLSGLNRFGTDQPPLPTVWLEQGCDRDMGGQCSTSLPARPRQSAGSSHQTRVYQTIGLVTHLLDRYLSAGLYAMIPYGAFTAGHSFFVDEREQYFSNSLHAELYSDRFEAISLAFGAGSQLTDSLSIGLSLTLNLANEADAQTYVGNSALIADTLLLSTDIEVQVGVAPHVGLNYHPIEKLSLSATLHTPQKMEIATAFGTFLPNGDLQIAERKATHAWLPWTIAAGGQYDLVRTPSHRFGIVANATFARWSQYMNRQSERPRAGYAWSDGYTVSGGFRHSLRDRLRSFLDATYAPSPVPTQSGRDNYVDNDRFAFSAGTEVEIPIHAWDAAVKIGVNAQLHYMPRRVHRKVDPTSPELSGGEHPQLVQDEWPDGATNVATGERIPEAEGLQTNNPGWPGYASKGILGGGGIHFTLLY